MSIPSDDSALVEHAGDGGIVAAHPTAEPLGFCVAPTVSADKNVLRYGVTPIACWRAEDARFAFDSSFVHPDIRYELRHLGLLRRRHAKPVLDGQASKINPPMSIFGHADPSGTDDYNKRLSSRRAKAIYGLLTRNVTLWESLYKQPMGDNDWGLKSVQIMLSFLDGAAIPTDGQQDESTSQAIRAFQQQHGLGTSGQADAGTRSVLFRAYMDALCGDALLLDPKIDFLAKGDGEHLKGDVQGCGELNPVMYFSQQEENAFSQDSDKTRRNNANAPNRRVLVLLFEPGICIDPAAWPCPHADASDAGCKKRLWSDASTRRSSRLPDARRRYERGDNTFACRFYERLLYRSPCELPVLRGVTDWSLTTVKPIPAGSEDGDLDG